MGGEAATRHGNRESVLRVHAAGFHALVAQDAFRVVADVKVVINLYRLSHGGKNFYARDDKHRDAILKKEFHANAKVEVSRFKGLGEMMAAQLKETTMDPKKRTLLQVTVVEADRKNTDKSVERLMGNKPESRFEFIQERAEFAGEDLLDV